MKLPKKARLFDSCDVILLKHAAYGRLGDEPFFEPTETINVSARGGLIPISAGVARQQELVLTNMQTEEELLCRVARLIRSERGQMLVGLEFVQSAPSFWRAAPATND